MDDLQKPETGLITPSNPKLRALEEQIADAVIDFYSNYSSDGLERDAPTFTRRGLILAIEMKGGLAELEAELAETKERLSITEQELIAVRGDQSFTVADAVDRIFDEVDELKASNFVAHTVKRSEEVWSLTLQRENGSTLQEAFEVIERELSETKAKLEAAERERDGARKRLREIASIHEDTAGLGMCAGAGCHVAEHWPCPTYRLATEGAEDG